MVNIDPPDNLPDHWHKEFRSEYQECITRKYNSFNEEQYRARLRDQIQKEKEHRRLLNLCVFPFTSDPSPSEFKFVRADPLTEIDEPNFDFLLWDFNGQAIFGEAKANIQQGANSLVNECQEQIDAVERNRDYIVENYLGEEPRHIEYVMTTFSSDADEITRSVIKKGVEVVTWAVHQMDKQVSVNTVFPERIPDDEGLEEARRRILHSNRELNSTLERAKTAEGVFNIFPNADPVSKLQTLVTTRVNDDGYCFVNTEDVRQTVSDDLFYLEDSTAREFADELIQLAVEIDFLKKYPDHEADFKLKSRYTNSEGLEKDIERKWVDHKVRKMVDDFQETCYQYAKDSVNEQTEIDEFL